MKHETHSALPPRNEVIMYDVPLKLATGTKGDSSSRQWSRDDITLSTMDSSCRSAESATSSSFILTDDSSSGVRFDLASTICITVKAIDDLKDYERRAAWYDRDGYNVIAGANTLTAKLMKIGRENPESFGHCYRGLEHRMTEVRQRRDESITRACQAVFEEQSRQVLKTTSRNMAKAYRLSTLTCLERALALAESDAQAAAAYQKEYASHTPPPSRRLSTTPEGVTLALSPEETTTSSSFDINSITPREHDADDDDSLSLLSDEDSNEFAPFASEGPGLLVKRFKAYVQKRRSSVESRSTNSSKSSISSSSRSSRRSRSFFGPTSY
jgi:hypothetical protein